jgi:hypothetical protein
MQSEAEIIEPRKAGGESPPNIPLKIEHPPIAGCCLDRRLCRVKKSLAVFRAVNATFARISNAAGDDG